MDLANMNICIEFEEKVAKKHEVFCAIASLY